MSVCEDIATLSSTSPVGIAHKIISALEFAGPFQGKMFLVAVHAFSKWPEVFVMSSTSNSFTIEMLCRMFARYGLPEQIVSNNCPQFFAEEFTIFKKLSGIKHIRSVFYPSTNGFAKRFVQTLKQSLIASLSLGLPLTRRLISCVLTALLHTLLPVFSIFEARSPYQFDLLRPNHKSQMPEKQSQQKVVHDRHARHRPFEVGQPVMAKNFIWSINVFSENCR